MGFDYDLYVVTPLMLVGPWVLGGFFGWRWGGSQRGLAAAVLLGLLLTGAGLAAFLLASPSSAAAACGEDECLKILGRWLELTLAREWPLYTVAAWVFGVAIGSSRQVRRMQMS